MTTSAAPTADLEERLDRMALQLEELTVEMRLQREQREKWQELGHDLAFIGQGAMASVSRELEDLSSAVTVEDAVAFLRHLAMRLPTLEASLTQLESLAELADELSHISGGAISMLTERLAELQAAGYLDFARSGVGVVDRVVRSFSEDDVDALGDNIVLILETVKEMTQPEVMTMLRRTVSELPPPPAEPPSLLTLLKDLRTPEVRRGLSRLTALLRSLGDMAPAAVPATTTDRAGRP